MRRRSRVVAGAMLALWLAVPCAAAVHGALEAHEFCAEHKAFEHGTDSATPRLDEAGGPVVTAAPKSHDSCALGDALVREAITVDAPAGACNAAPTTLTNLPAPYSHVAATAVLAVAPKTSPPSPVV